MVSDMDLLMFLISAIIAVVIVVWMVLSNNKVRNYGVGENDLPTTKSPGVPGFSKISYKNADFNEYGLPILKPGTIPMPEVKPIKQKPLEEYTLAEIYGGSNELKYLIIKALEKSITNENVHEVER